MRSRIILVAGFLFMGFGFLIWGYQPYNAFAQTDVPEIIPEPPIFAAGDTFVYQGYKTLDDAIAGSGPKWTSNRVTQEVRPNGDLLVYFNGSDNGRLYNKAGNLIRKMRVGRKDRDYVPSWELYRYPMKVGDTFKVEFSYPPSKPAYDFKIVERAATVSVVGWETITVPAGNFEALKIEMKGIYVFLPKSWRSTFTETIWVTRQTKMRPILRTYTARWKTGGEENFTSLSSFSLK